MYELVWTPSAAATFESLRAKAQAAMDGRGSSRTHKSTKDAGLFKQVVKCITHLQANPRHPGLHTHAFHSLPHPYDKAGKVFEAYVQNRTPGAYRLFWCYGPGKRQITVIAITPHP
jgi:hypothetical protein